MVPYSFSSPLSSLLRMFCLVRTNSEKTRPGSETIKKYRNLVYCRKEKRRRGFTFWLWPSHLSVTRKLLLRLTRFIKIFDVGGCSAMRFLWNISVFFVRPSKVNSYVELNIVVVWNGFLYIVPYFSPNNIGTPRVPRHEGGTYGCKRPRAQRQGDVATEAASRRSREGGAKDGGDHGGRLSVHRLKFGIRLRVLALSGYQAPTGVDFLWALCTVFRNLFTPFVLPLLKERSLLVLKFYSRLVGTIFYDVSRNTIELWLTIPFVYHSPRDKIMILPCGHSPVRKTTPN